MASLTQLMLALCIVLLMGCSKAPLTEEQAFARIQSLPEVTKLSERLRTSDRDARLVIRDEPGYEAMGDDYFVYYIGEKHAAHTTLVLRLAVHKKSGAIFALDPMSGKLVPLAEWRQQKAH